MDDLCDDRKKASSSRIEIYAGSGRRRWPDEVKAKIVSESLVPGAVVTEVARRFGCRPQQVHDWRRQAREGLIILPALTELPMFAAIVAEPSEPPEPVIDGAIEVELAQAFVRVRGRPGAAALNDVFLALRQSTRC